MLFILGPVTYHVINISDFFAIIMARPPLGNDKKARLGHLLFYLLDIIIMLLILPKLALLLPGPLYQ